MLAVHNACVVVFDVHVLPGFSVHSLQAELFTAQEASLRGGVRAGPATWRHRPLPLSHGLPPAGGGAAHLPQRLPASVEWQGAQLQG